MKGKFLKRMLIIFIISLIFIAFKDCNSYGDIISLSDEGYEDWIIYQITADDETIKNDLYSYYNYEGELKDKMKFVTEFKITKIGRKKYTIGIGNAGNNGNGISGTYEELKEIWGLPEDYDEDNIEVGISWDVVLEVSYTLQSEDLEDGSHAAVITIDKIYWGEDYEEGLDLEVEGEDAVFETITESTDDDDSSSNGLKWVRKFVTNPIGTFTNVILDVLKEIADAVQMLINLVQTVPLGVYDDWTVKYEQSVLSSEGEDGKRNQYTNVSGTYEDTGNTKEYKLSVSIEDTESDNYLFEETKIPIIYVDFYTMALNKVSALDINFLTVDKTLHGEDSVWKKLRDFVSSLVLLAFYIAAILLIMALIWMGVQIVNNTVNPYTRAKNEEGLHRLIIGVIMLVGTLLIMALSIFSYQAVLGDVYDENSYELPIRVHFNQDWSSWFGLAGDYNNDYSFSTSFTGYIRFMAEIENPDRCLQKAGYVIAYVVLVIMNVIVLIIMIIRTLVMWVLSIVGPILAAIYAITSNQKVMNWYKSWAFIYIIFALIQVIFAAICVILLNVMEFS